MAKAQGKDALAGAAGASTGELTAKLALDLYGKKPEQLGEDERQLVSSLSSVAAGLAGAAVSDNTAGVQTAAQAGKNAVENNSLAGDKARESVKESAEWWKAQIRNKLGENTVSQIANGLVNVAAETGDVAMLGGDTAFDVIAALATCAAGDSYCNQAQNDIAKKDAAAGKVLTGIMNGNAWQGIKSMLVKAANGDQKALENFAGVLSGVLIPAKSLPVGKSTSTASAGKGTISNVTEDVAGTSGSRHPLLDDAIPRNGDRTVVYQGALPTCGHNSCGMVLDTMGKPVDIVRLISSTPPTSGGITSLQVSNILKSEGVNAAAWGNRGVSDLSRYTANGTPVIARIADKTGGSSFSHFVVVDGVTTRNGISVVAIRDPWGKQYFSPVSTFEKNFTGDVVVPKGWQK